MSECPPGEDMSEYKCQLGRLLETLSDHRVLYPSILIKSVDACGAKCLIGEFRV